MGIHFLNPYPKAEEDDTVLAEEVDNGDDEDFEEVKIVRKLQITFLDGQEGDKSTEFAGLEDVIVNSVEDNQSRNKHRSSRSNSYSEESR